LQQTVLDNVTPDSPTSYHLKHLVEKWSNEYIPNGALIAAVIHLGIPYEKHSDYPNIDVAVNLSAATSEVR
jgi:hypothetical protein